MGCTFFLSKDLYHFHIVRFKVFYLCFSYVGIFRTFFGRKAWPCQRYIALAVIKYLLMLTSRHLTLERLKFFVLISGFLLLLLSGVFFLTVSGSCLDFQIVLVVCYLFYGPTGLVCSQGILASVGGSERTMQNGWSVGSTRGVGGV